jgi:hypothetical protein
MRKIGIALAAVAALGLAIPAMTGSAQAQDTKVVVKKDRPVHKKIVIKKHRPMHTKVVIKKHRPTHKKVVIKKEGM